MDDWVLCRIYKKIDKSKTQDPNTTTSTESTPPLLDHEPTPTQDEDLNMLRSSESTSLLDHEPTEMIDPINYYMPPQPPSQNAPLVIDQSINTAPIKYQFQGMGDNYINPDTLNEELYWNIIGKQYWWNTMTYPNEVPSEFLSQDFNDMPMPKDNSPIPSITAAIPDWDHL